MLLTPAETRQSAIETAAFAARFAERADVDSIVLHVHADTAVQLTTELAQIAYELVDSALPLNASQAVRALRAWLGEHEGWILVAYGVQNDTVLAPLLDLSGGRVLVACGPDVVTVRNDVSVVRIEPLDSGPASPELVLDDSAQRVAELVEFSPLGLATATALVEQGEQDWPGLLASLLSTKADWLDDASGVDRVLAHALDRLARSHPTETKLLSALSSLTPSIVPVSTLERAGSALGSTLLADGRPAGEIVDELATRGLVGLVTRRDGVERGVEILGPVRRLLWRSMSSAARDRWHRRTVALAIRTLLDRRIDPLDVLPIGVCAARRALSTGVANESPVPAVGEALRRQGFRMAADELLEDPRAREALRTDIAARLARIRIAAEALVERLEFGAAIRESERAIAIAESERENGSERDPAVEHEVALLHLVRAGANRRLGRQAEAARALAPLLDEAENISAVHVQALIELGEIETCRGGWAEARTALDTAVTVSRKSTVDDPRSTLTAELAYCRLLLQQRALHEADRRLPGLLSEFSASRTGGEHLTALLRLHGEVQLRLEREAAAEEAYRRALAIDEILGDAALSAVALDQAGIAFTLQQRGRHAEAATLYRRVLQHLVESSGVDPERVPVVLARQCWSLVETGDLEQALDFSRRAVRLRSRRPLPSNMDLAEILESRATVLMAVDRVEEAIPLLSRAVRIAEECAIDAAAESRSARLSLARCLVECGRDSEALPHVEALDVQEQVLRNTGRGSAADELRERIAGLRPAGRSERPAPRPKSDSDVSTTP